MTAPVVARWSVSADLQPLSGGRRNRVFRAADVVFKSTTRSPEAVAWLCGVHAHARQAGFVVPELLESREGRLIEDGWTCERFVPGRPFRREEMAELRPGLTAFHAATADLSQRPGFQSSTALLSVRKGGDVDLDAMPPDLVDGVRDAWRKVAQRPAAVIHGDLFSENVLRADDGGVALIDWDESRRDLTLFDLGQLGEDDAAARRAHLAWEIACSWVVEPAYARRLAKRF